MNLQLSAWLLALAATASALAQAQTPQQDEAAQSARAAQAEARAAESQARAAARAQARAETRPQARGRGVTVPGEGKVYAPGPFDSLVVDGTGQVRLVQGDRDEVFVPGNDNAQEEVDVRLVGNRMRIDLPGSWKFWNNGNAAPVEVRVRHLSKLTMSGTNDLVALGLFNSDQLTISMTGSGVARFDQLQVGRLRFDISGAGEGQLAGNVDDLRLSVSGKGKIGAEQLRTGRADVSISGVGNAVLWVMGELRVQISGAGHVDYWGQPAVRKTISGFGSVDARGDKK